MATSIEQINDVIAKLRSDRRAITPLLKRTKAATLTIGAESEYQVQGLIGGIESLATDVGGLIKAERTFLILTNHLERQTLLSHLTVLSTHLNSVSTTLDLASKNGLSVNTSFQFTNPTTGAPVQIPLNDVLVTTEAIKPILRSLRTKESPERFKELGEQVSEFIRSKQECEIIAEAVLTLRKQAETHKKEIEDLVADGSRAIEQLKILNESAEQDAEKVSVRVPAAEERLAAMSALVEKLSSKAIELDELYSQTAEQAAVVDQFSKKVESRNIELDRQSSITQSYEEQLKAFERKHAFHLDEISKTLAEARRALTSSGEVALGSHFKKQYDTAKKGQWLWIILAFGMFVGAIVLGYLTVTASGDDSLAYLRRFTLVPLALLGAYFCGRQYEKQTGIAEDYAHKKVLALSLTSFKDQLAGDPNGDTQLNSYLQQVLAELHRYPLILQQQVNMQKKNLNESNQTSGEPSFKTIADQLKYIEEMIASLKKLAT